MQLPIGIVQQQASGGSFAGPIVESAGIVGLTVQPAQTYIDAPACTGYNSGDMLMLLVGSGASTNSAGTIQTPSGWVSMIDAWIGSRHVAIFWKVATGVASVQRVNVTDNTDSWAQQIRISGADTTTPLDGSSNDKSMTPTPTDDIPEFTTTEDNVLALFALCTTSSNGTPFSVDSNWSIMGDSGYQNGQQGCTGKRNVPATGGTEVATVTLTGVGGYANGVQIGIRSA
ncbi:MAG: hypothetical protein DRQ89_14605 [Epsilonproteobacteria bacterium]|nr:MAG: hypothetical protein DRQ89_14605 [Campylobacterota bacterium]